MSITEKLFGFQGRIRRKDWWLWQVVIAIVGWVLASVVFGTSMGRPGFSPGMAVVMGPAVIVPVVIRLLLLWPSLALSIKRMHDRGKSAKLLLIPYILFAFTTVSAVLTVASAAGGVSGGLFAGFGLTMILGLLSLIAGVWLLIELGFLDGTPGPNEYGPSPKGLGDAATAGVI